MGCLSTTCFCLREQVMLTRENLKCVRISHPLISIRLWDNHLEPAVMSANLSLMQRRRGACDEVWFATDYSFPPLAVHQDHARLMAEAAAQVRAEGIGASLQISNTLGHGEYLKFLDFRGLANPMIGCDGTVAPYCSCPRAPEFHAYLDAFTRAYCAWQPDRLWIDDDLRMHNHAPVDFGCFCDRCLAEFVEGTDRAWTREDLVKAINEDNDFAMRAAWLQFCRDSAAGVAKTVGRAAIAAAPECQLGFQHCDQSSGGYNGPDWHHVFRVLADISGKPPGSRPGGGFYNDHRPREMICKALMTGLQNARLPDYVGLISYECENLPGSVIGKSAHGTAVESTLAIAQGCNSLSFTHLMFPHESAWHETMMIELEAWRPFWERCIAANTGTRNTGVEVVFSRQNALRRLNPNERRFAWASMVPETIASAAVLGLPLCWDERAPAAWLTAPAAYGVDETELRLLLARGLLVGGEAVEILEQRGLANVLGLRFTPISHAFSDLRITDDELNGAFAGQTLVCGGFMFGTPRSVEVIGGKARCLSRYVHNDGTQADVEAVAVEHADGGRLVVFGWGVGNATVTTSRRHQILAAANWVSRNRLPAWLETACQVVLFPRCDAQGQVETIFLLNVSLDHTPQLKLKLPKRGDDQAWTWARPMEPDIAVPASATLTLPPLAPWSVGVLVRDGNVGGCTH